MLGSHGALFVQAFVFEYSKEQLGSYVMGLEYLDFVTTLPNEAAEFKKAFEIDELLPKASVK